jgi:hypothetical protein
MTGVLRPTRFLSSVGGYYGNHGEYILATHTCWSRALNADGERINVLSEPIGMTATLR